MTDAARHTQAQALKSAQARFWKYAGPRPASGCWLWKGNLTEEGYARLAVGRKHQRGHRFSYELHVGPIPAGLTIDHLCRVRRCINPDHMEVVTRRVNTLRGVGVTAQAARSTACPAGHPYDRLTSVGWRYCSICDSTCRKARRRRR